MNDDWLYDGEGEPDAETKALMEKLGTLRFPEEKLGQVLPSAVGDEVTVPTPANRPMWALLFGLGLAAASVAAGIAMIPTPQLSMPDTEGWSASVVEGAPRVETIAQVGGFELGIGDWLETDSSSRATVDIADIGVLDVAPNSRLRVQQTGPDGHRLELAKGEVHASVLAPPRLFIIDTPAAAAVDLGCAYTLRVNDDGNGWIHVTSGWVALEHGERNSFVPAGARAETRRDYGPGMPYFVDSSPALQSALSSLDFEQDPGDAVSVLLREARDRDSLSLVHALERVDRSNRQLIYDQILTLIPTLSAERAEAVLRLDAVALNELLTEVSVVW